MARNNVCWRRRESHKVTAPGVRESWKTEAFSRRGLLAGAALGTSALLSGCGTTSDERAHGSASDSAASDDASSPATGSTFAFDTYCSFTVYGDPDALSKLSDACARYDRLFDLYDPDSDIARINAAGGSPVTVDAATCELIQKALTYCERADSLFDITIGAVSTLWDFVEGVRPTDDAIAAALAHVDWRNVSVDAGAGTVTLADPAAKLDLGGIAKGFVADKLVELLRSETAATGAVLSLGGNVVTYGSKPDGNLWNVGVRDPDDPGGTATLGTAHIDEPLSLVTSGLYERTFELNGTTYWHILDPRTGYPVATDVVSVSVACPSSTTADALSTTLFVAGSKQGVELANAQEHTGALFVLHDNHMIASDRWQELTSFEG